MYKNYAFKIIKWEEKERAEAYKPSKFKRFLMKLGLINLAKPKYWMYAYVTIERGSSVRENDIILLPPDKQFLVMWRGVLHSERLLICSIEPIKPLSYTGDAVIISSVCPSELSSSPYQFQYKPK